MADDTRQVVCYVDKQYIALFHAIVNAVNLKDTPWIAGRIFLQGLEQEMKKYSPPEKFAELDRETQLEILKVRRTLKDERQSALKWIASQDLSEDDAEVLAAIADDLGLDIDAAMEFGEKNPFAQTIAYNTSPNTKIGRCAQWLAELFTQNTEISRNVVMTLGEQHGYTSSMINRAKKQVGLSSEKRTGGAWWWLAPRMELPDNNNNNNNNNSIKDIVNSDGSSKPESDVTPPF